MARYIVIKSYDDEDAEDMSYIPMIPMLQVDGATPEFTGILDANGSPICKLARPIGFGRDNEW